MKFNDCLSCALHNSNTCITCIKASKYKAKYPDLCYICRISSPALTKSKTTREILCKYCEGKDSNFKEITQDDLKLMQAQSLPKEKTMPKYMYVN